MDSVAFLKYLTAVLSRVSPSVLWSPAVPGSGLFTSPVSLLLSLLYNGTDSLASACQEERVTRMLLSLTN